jgi:transposase
VPYKIPPCQVSKEVLIDLYTTQKLSTTEVAKRLGTSHSVISKLLSEYGISARKVGSNIKRKRGLAYGQKILAGQQQEFKKERDNISKMIELRAKGYSYRKIAEIFSSMKIRTKTGKEKWHGRTIHNILLNHSETQI